MALKCWALYPTPEAFGSEIPFAVALARMICRSNESRRTVGAARRQNSAWNIAFQRFQRAHAIIRQIDFKAGSGGNKLPGIALIVNG